MVGQCVLCSLDVQTYGTVESNEEKIKLVADPFETEQGLPNAGEKESKQIYNRAHFCNQDKILWIWIVWALGSDFIALSAWIAFKITKNEIWKAVRAYSFISFSLSFVGMGCMLLLMACIRFRIHPPLISFIACVFFCGFGALLTWIGFSFLM